MVLQWGRSFSERRTPLPGLVDGLDTAASMGPLFFRAENGSAGQREPLVIQQASMGPLFFRAENLFGIPRFFRHRLLQWGRSFSERRTQRCRKVGEALGLLQWGRSFSERRTIAALKPVLWPRPRFNGAALFQSGERDQASRVVSHRQLQWGRSFSERRTGDVAILGPLSTPASMGPLFFRAENAQMLVQSGFPEDASMGPLFFRAENLYTAPKNTPKRTASMGPLFFRAENAPFRSPPLHCVRIKLQWGRSFSERRTIFDPA